MSLFSETCPRFVYCRNLISSYWTVRQPIVELKKGAVA